MLNNRIYTKTRSYSINPIEFGCIYNGPNKNLDIDVPVNCSRTDINNI